ncbi:MAG: hypothetical protein HKL90_10060 [Elusimicrobia bacterium]|nr:hypothetical protein [Elusimicrobiota bacterium]
MIRASRTLAALLLLSPVGAQVLRLPAVEPPLAAVANTPLASGAAFAAAPVLAPSAALAPALGAVAPLSAAATPEAPAPPNAAAAPAASAAPAAPVFSAAEADQKHAPPSAASPAFAPRDSGRALFDGSSARRTRSGSVFVPSYSAANRRRPGGFALVRALPGPAAPVRPVAGTEGLVGQALLARLGQITARGQIPADYHAASQYLFSTADNHTLDGTAGVADAYSGVFIPGVSGESRDYSESGDKTHDGWSRPQSMNVEHVFPQSLFESRLPMRSDLHHLMATLEHPNGMRGRLPFGIVKGTPDYRNDAGARRGGGVFEPPDFTKGRVARAMLYFYARYHREAFFDVNVARFWNAQVDVLLDWNRRFPPTVEELRRNDQVESFQKNRNPFVDDPALAEKIGRDAWRASAPRAPAAVAQFQAPARRSDAPRKGKGKKGRPNKNKPRRFRRRSRWNASPSR